MEGPAALSAAERTAVAAFQEALRGLFNAQMRPSVGVVIESGNPDTIQLRCSGFERIHVQGLIKACKLFWPPTTFQHGLQMRRFDVDMRKAPMLAVHIDLRRGVRASPSTATARPKFVRSAANGTVTKGRVGVDRGMLDLDQSPFAPDDHDAVFRVVTLLHNLGGGESISAARGITVDWETAPRCNDEAAAEVCHESVGTPEYYLALCWCPAVIVSGIRSVDSSAIGRFDFEALHVPRMELFAPKPGAHANEGGSVRAYVRPVANIAGARAKREWSKRVRADDGGAASGKRKRDGGGW